MLQPERMSKVMITAPKTLLDRTVSELYSIGAVHIVDHTKNELDIGQPLGNAPKISETLVAVRSLISNLGLHGSMQLNNGFRAVGVKNFAQLAKQVRLLQQEVGDNLSKAKQAEDETKKIAGMQKTLSELAKLGLPVEAYEDYKSLAVFVGHSDAPAETQKELAKLTEEFEIHRASEGNLIAVFVANNAKEKASDALLKHGFSELDTSQVRGMKKQPGTLINELEEKKLKVTQSKEAAQKSLERLAMKWHDFLLLSNEFLSIELEKAEAPLRFAASEHIFTIKGWVPSGNLKELDERMNKLTRGTYELRVEDAHHSDTVPVKLQNKGAAKPFEFLMNLYSLPKYGEIDPTLFLFITFPLFFGIILGDAGYGLAVLLLAELLERKIPSSHKLTRVIRPAAISSMFFGILFGEVLGFEQLLGYELPHLISRIHQVEEMLVISVIIGLLHVNIGILLGFINESAHEGIRKAILAKGSWWVMQLGVAAMAASAMGIAGLPIVAGAAIAAAGLAMLVIGAPMEIVEVPGLISNILSYSRLMAVGLASVSLAVVVNGFVEGFAQAGGVMLLFAVIVGLAGHALNIALGLLGGFLHSIRLHYVEFFTKFFKGGAIPFKPFGKRTEEVT